MSECDLLDVANVGKIQDEGYLVLLYPERESLVRGVSSNVCEASCMVYQFQPDLSGKVVYERIRPAMAGSIEPWIDIHFPGSDIPLPARQMYLIRPLRVIFDNDKAPVEVIGLPQNGHTDLSKCVLRASHPVHASYLKNMGVRSSMSIAIVIDSELWGLVCFHAYGEARHPRGWETSFFESLSVPVSANLARMHRDAYELRRDSLSRVVDKGFSCTGVLEFFRNHAIELLGVMEADCVSIFCADRVHSWGDPGLAMTDDSLKRVLRHSDGQECVIGKLSEPRRGVLCIKNPGLVVAFARRSVVLDKVWGGDPFHVKIMRPDGVPGPRGSFERYVQSDADSLNSMSAENPIIVEVKCEGGSGGGESAARGGGAFVPLSTHSMSAQNPIIVEVKCEGGNGDGGQSAGDGGVAGGRGGRSGQGGGGESAARGGRGERRARALRRLDNHLSDGLGGPDSIFFTNDAYSATYRGMVDGVARYGQ
eukprot:g4011.t1